MSLTAECRPPFGGSVLKEFENVYDGTFTGSGASTPANQALATAGIAFLANAVAARRVADALMLANHPARRGINSPHEIRAWRDAAPTIAIGMEGAPGHQAAGIPKPLGPGGGRGFYEASPGAASFPGYPLESYRTFGGFDWMTATVGRLWDSLLAEGKPWWITANSDSHVVYTDTAVRGPGIDFPPTASTTTRRHPDFAWALLTRMSFVLATAFATGFLLFLLQDAVSYEQVFPGSTAEGGVTILIAVFTAMAVPVACGVGAWSDRLGRRKPFVVAGSVVFALGCLVLTRYQTWPSVLGAAVLMGAGIGCFAAVDAPINAGVLPAAAHRAGHLAVATLAAVLPQIVAPALGAPIIAFLGGYPTLYAVAGGSALLAALLVQPIRGLR